MPMSNLEENFELVRENSIAEKSVIAEESIKESKDVIVFSEVSLKRYRKFCGEERRYNVYTRLIKGNVIAYEMPGNIHS
ncbi:12321_t:CDS:2, partial [Funneliformis mosseae]